ncbi:MAG: hydroxyacid dehydrogenase [Spirochaetes bacterium]|nr:MAG: hydroxyacid dehydrogenase [Spirochaetota bacterium]
MKKKIVSMSPLPPDILRMLIEGAGVSVPDDFEIINANPLEGDALIDAVREADVIMGDYTFNKRITPEIARAAKRVKLIQQPSVGYQNIDVDACTARGIPVANTAGANTVSVAEHTIAAGLCLLKKFLPAARSTAAGGWVQMDLGGGEIEGKTWGLVGMGRIGRAVALRLIPFGVSVMYFDTARLNPDDEKTYRCAYAPLDELFKSADILSLHCPLTPDTAGLVNEARISTMKPAALIINVARGEVLDEAALARALAEKRIGGAAVDVFSREPIESGNPLLGLSDANLLLTPHVAGVTGEARMRIISVAVGNIIRVLNGGKPELLVNEV